MQAQRRGVERINGGSGDNVGKEERGSVCSAKRHLLPRRVVRPSRWGVVRALEGGVARGRRLPWVRLLLLLLLLLVGCRWKGSLEAAGLGDHRSVCLRRWSRWEVGGVRRVGGE